MTYQLQEHGRLDRGSAVGACVHARRPATPQDDPFVVAAKEATEKPAAVADRMARPDDAAQGRAGQAHRLSVFRPDTTRSRRSTASSCRRPASQIGWEVTVIDGKATAANWINAFNQALVAQARRHRHDAAVAVDHRTARGSCRRRHPGRRHAFDQPAGAERGVPSLQQSELRSGRDRPRARRLGGRRFRTAPRA